MNAITINAKLVKNHWAATENDVETLAHERYTNSVAVKLSDCTYLQICVVAAQALLGRSRRGGKPAIDAQLSVLEATHKKFYPAVLRGITTPDIAVEPGIEAKEQSRRALERNARSNFARSAMGTLVFYVRGGGDLRALDPETVTKAGLREAVTPKETGDPGTLRMKRASEAILKAVARRVEDDPGKAREELETLMDELQKVLDTLDGGPRADEEDPTETTVRPPARDTGAQRTRVGIPMFHRSAQP